MIAHSQKTFLIASAAIALPVLIGDGALASSDHFWESSDFLTVAKNPSPILSARVSSTAVPVAPTPAAPLLADSDAHRIA
ncbi:MAG: hypothetical protein AAFY72_14320, partial [Cyanobacteria bacterium J06649_4]